MACNASHLLSRFSSSSRSSAAFISPKNNGWNRVKYALLWQLHVACCTCARNAASSCVAADAADLSAACCVPHVSSSLLINHSRAAETTRIRQARPGTAQGIAPRFRSPISETISDRFMWAAPARDLAEMLSTICERTARGGDGERRERRELLDL